MSCEPPRRLRALTGAALIALTTGCGDPLVGPQYLGERVFEIGGSVVQRGGRIPSSHGAINLSLFWIGGSGDLAKVEQSAELGSGLASFSLTLFDPPPAEASTFGDLRGDQGRLGLALIALYADQDADGRFDQESELVLGASARHLIGWTDSALPAGSAAAGLLGTVGRGYQLFEYDGPEGCSLTSAASCPGVGKLAPVAATSTVVLSLWDAPEAVEVPSPALGAEPMPTTIWAER